MSVQGISRYEANIRKLEAVGNTLIESVPYSSSVCYAINPQISPGKIGLVVRDYGYVVLPIGAIYEAAEVYKEWAKR